MPRFDVYLNTGAQAATTPYLLDVQSDLLQGLETRIVVPLRRRDRFPVSWTFQETKIPHVILSYEISIGYLCDLRNYQTTT